MIELRLPLPLPLSGGPLALSWVLLAACGGDCGGDAPHTVTPGPESPTSAPAAAPTPVREADGPGAAPIVEGELPPSDGTPTDDGAEQGTGANAASPPKPAKRAPAQARKPAKNETKNETKSQTTKREEPAQTGSDAKPATEAPKQAAAPPAAPAAPAKKTTVPKTAHVRVSVDPTMQKLLDADSRMEGWLNRIMPVIDGCYRGLDQRHSGVIQLNVTMHKNSRPGVAVKSLPSQLAGLLPCATTKLMNQRSPLFVGPEGQRHTVSIHFTP